MRVARGHVGLSMLTTMLCLFDLQLNVLGARALVRGATSIGGAIKPRTGLKWTWTRGSQRVFVHVALQALAKLAALWAGRSVRKVTAP